MNLAAALAVLAAADNGTTLAHPLPDTPEPPVVVLSPPAPLPAPPEADTTPRVVEPTTNDSGGLELALGGTMFRPDLSRVRFGGSGVPIDGTRGRVGFSHTGRELGMQHPTLYGGELAVRYLRRYLALGVQGFIAGNPSGADAVPEPPNTEATQVVSARSLMAYGGALEAYGVLPLGYATLRAGPVGGIRAFSVSLPGFAAKTCHSRRYGDYPCTETASTNVQPYLQARASIDLTPTPKDSGGFFIGVYGGVDVLSDASPVAGLALGFRESHLALSP